MGDAKQIVTQLFKYHNINIPASSKALFEKFLLDKKNQVFIEKIVRNQNELMSRWKQEEMLAKISQQPVRVLNATVGKPYETLFDIEKLNWKEIAEFHFEGLQELGLIYDERSKQLTGTPTKSGDYKIKFLFRLKDEPPETEMHEKLL